MKRRKKKWPNGKKPKLHHGGVFNESQKMEIGDVVMKIERVGRGFTTRLVDSADPHNLRGRR